MALMKDDEHPSDAITTKPTSTPPAVKVQREIFRGWGHLLFYIVILIVSLLANRWEIKDAPNMSMVVYGLLLTNAALRKAEGSIDMSAIVEVIRETLRR